MFLLQKMNNVKTRWKFQEIEQLLLVLTIWCLMSSSIHASDCDVFISSTSFPRNGTFHSPVYPLRNRGIQCLYKFVGTSQEKVQINFTEFKLRGFPPKCSYDYIDVYTQIKNASASILEAPLDGRFCGNNPDDLPHLLVSMYNILIIGFYAEEMRRDNARDVGLGFKGIYKFINASKYTIGTPDRNPDSCGQTIEGSKVTKGILLSPTYPGVYPDNIFCYYKIQGHLGQRIKFTFLDLDLYSGGDHCPFDYVKIYDGYTNEAKVIGTYCGRQKNFAVYSTTEALHIVFRTKSGRVKPTVTYWEMKHDLVIRRKGFKAEFEISDRFVDLSFIKEGDHVRGTECDQRVMSKTESNGSITSPDFPNKYPLDVTCRYFVDGLVDRQNLEKVKMTFEVFNIPKDNNHGCNNGNLSVYLQGQDLLRERPDRTFCGPNPPSLLESKDPRLLLEFKSGRESAGVGFKANYQFVTDYGIPGTRVSEATCQFEYRSSPNHRQGAFNSPRYPSNYPQNTVCVYDFYGSPKQNIRVTFEHFNIENRLRNCSTDYIDAFTYMNDREVKIGHYCGDKLPGPIVVNGNRLKFIFQTDNTQFNSGFRAQYEFLEPKSVEEITTYCGDHIIDTGGGGVIHSPNYPHKYQIPFTCEWSILAHKMAHIMVILEDNFDMEGNMGVDGHGCGNAVLKIYTNTSDIPTYEICGKDLQNREFVSQEQYIKIQFISSSTAVGARGFQITWTEIYPSSLTDFTCNTFKCETSGHCISSHLKCNLYPNCGVNDNSDEANCSRDYADQSVLHIILGVVISLIVLVFIIVCILHRRRKQQKRRNKKEIEVRYVTRAAVGNHNKYADHNHDFADRTLLTERTEKVSIV